MSMDWVCAECDSPCEVLTAKADFSPEFCPFDKERNPRWSSLSEDEDAGKLMEELADGRLL